MSNTRSPRAVFSSTIGTICMVGGDALSVKPVCGGSHSVLNVRAGVKCFCGPTRRTALVKNRCIAREMLAVLDDVRLPTMPTIHVDSMLQERTF